MDVPEVMRSHPAAGDPVQTRYLSRPGGCIAYDIAGQGPLVVCLPGMGDLRSAHRFLVPQLVTAGHRVASMDLRGHGDSDASFDAYDDVAAGGDVLALVRELGGPAILIGNSMGAGAAAWAAAESPVDVAGLVLVGPFVREASAGTFAALAFRLALLRPWGPAAWRSYYSSLFPAAKPADHGTHVAAIRASLARPGRWAAFVRTTRTSHAPVEARLDEVLAPTLVVMGSRDPDFKDPRAEATWIADRLRAQVVMVDGAGHYPQAEFPQIVGPAVVRFLADIERAAGQAPAPTEAGDA